MLNKHPKPTRNIIIILSNVDEHSARNFLGEAGVLSVSIKGELLPQDTCSARTLVQARRHCRKIPVVHANWYRRSHLHIIGIHALSRPKLLPATYDKKLVRCSAHKSCVYCYPLKFLPVLKALGTRALRYCILVFTEDKSRIRLLSVR